ncbi:hypothetical protein TPHA_0D03510 [Tetrapisispora phaffii CBS 4417]|uniref:Uncharacterized protein n=1 Tax=Tetrapisispora phaffii (strain ATCC 24235 / CBS 4417 / NBRC 1672 / NRRL Y-8282 / UCD 70-5) TaxID=1071381 RepID=G8BT15_TETPH|nr:hypothetical protein TPHA_0D03510 [Tetrapisispora phaffii CBS 4417]CCE62986.1 hypothetical protein TPHA_0D03510 [Tetrapisispora phaffii CBS 4417]
MQRNDCHSTKIQTVHTVSGHGSVSHFSHPIHVKGAGNDMYYNNSNNDGKSLLDGSFSMNYFAKQSDKSDLFMKSYPYGNNNMTLPITPPISASSSLTETKQLFNNYITSSPNTTIQTPISANKNKQAKKNKNMNKSKNRNRSKNQSHAPAQNSYQGKNMHPHPHPKQLPNSNLYSYTNSHFNTKSNSKFAMKPASVIPPNSNFAGASFATSLPDSNDLPKPSFV